MSASNEVGSVADRPRNTAGRVALVLGAILVAVNIAQGIVVQLAPYIQSSADLSAQQIALVFIPFEVVAGVIALVALIVGIIGLTRRGLPKGAAGAGTALGASTLIVLTVNLVAGLIYRVAI